MPEGVATAAGAVIGAGTFDDREHPPPPDPELAPKGWTWSRPERQWVPRQRGPVLAPPAGPGGLAGQVSDWVRREMPRSDDAGAPPYGQADLPGPDPGPGWQQDAGPAPQPIPVFELTGEGRADVEALVALAYTIPGEILPLADPYCFGPLGEKQTADGVIEAVSDIVCRSPRVARWALSASGLMPWIKLGKALSPVAVAAFHHHVMKDVEVEVDRKAKTMKVTPVEWQTEYPAA